MSKESTGYIDGVRWHITPLVTPIGKRFTLRIGDSNAGSFSSHDAALAHVAERKAIYARRSDSKSES